MKSGERADNRLIGPGDNDYGRAEKPLGFFSRKDHGGIPEEMLKESLKQAIKNMENPIPRRIRLDLNVPAELAIHNAIQEIERIGADVRLTNAQTLLQQAKELVSDYIDESIKQ